MISNKRQSPFKFLKVFLHIFMSIIYVAAGVLTINYKWFLVELKPIVAILFGVLLIIYGLFRGYRGYQVYLED